MFSRLIRAVVVFLVLLQGAAFAQEDIFSILQDVLSYSWQGPGYYRLEKSESILSVPAGSAVLLGQEARKLLGKLSDGDHVDAEAVLISTFDPGSLTTFESFQNGYVSLEGWEQLDPEEILAGLNEEGVVFYWVQKPVLDQQSSTVYFRLGMCDEDGNDTMEMSFLFRFGRYGYELIQAFPSSQKAEAVFEFMNRSHAFQPGCRYADFVPGDKISEQGLFDILFERD